MEDMSRCEGCGSPMNTRFIEEKYGPFKVDWVPVRNCERCLEEMAQELKARKWS